MQSRSLILSLLLFGVILWSYRIPIPHIAPSLRSAAFPLPSSRDDEERGMVSLPKASERATPEGPRRRPDVPDIIIDARAAFAVTTPGDAVLFAKNADEPLQIASISKLMTALVALERLPLTASVRVSEGAIRTEGDTAGLVVGETLSLHDALLAMLVPSSNDAAVAVAEAAGGMEAFVSAMNDAAQRFGMGTATFRNPHGLTPPGNTASARDVAKLLRFALSSPPLREMLRQETVRIVSVEGIAHELRTTNALLDRVPGAIGGKTGFTAESQGTLALAFAPKAALEKRQPREDDLTVLLVVLGSTDRFADTEALARWILGAYEWE